MHWRKVNRRIWQNDYGARYSQSDQIELAESSKDKMSWGIKMKKSLLTVFFMMLIMMLLQGTIYAARVINKACPGCGKTIGWDYAEVSKTQHAVFYSCNDCGRSNTTYESHTWGSWVSDGAGTTHTKTCTKCGYEKTESHSYGSWKYLNAGQHRKDCSVCNSYMLGTHTTTKAATCTTAAYCGSCSSNYGNALGHSTPTTFSTSTTQHWKLCSRNCGTYVYGKELHIDSNSDGLCDVCNYIMDNIAPVITITPNGNSTVAKQYSTVVTVTDEGGSGVGTCKYVWTTSVTAPASESGYTTTFTTGSSIKTPVATGTYYLHVLAKDGGENTTKKSSEGFALDNTAPIGTIKINDGAKYTTSTGVTLNISSNSSDVAEMSISETTTKASYETYATTKSWNLSSIEGEKTIYYWFKDVLGNESEMNQVSIILDTSNPTLGTLNVEASTTNTITVSVTGANDTISGIKNYDYYLDGTKVGSGIASATYTYTGLTPNTEYSLSYVVRDNVDKTAGPSAELTKYTLAAIPSGLTSSNGTSDNTISINWEANNNPVGTSYTLEASENGIDWIKLNVGTDLSYEHSSLEKNKIFQYRVKAQNEEGIFTNYSAITTGKTTQECISDSITYDKTAPVASFTLNENTTGVDLSFVVKIEENYKTETLKYKWTSTNTALTSEADFGTNTFVPGDTIYPSSDLDSGTCYLQIYTKDAAQNEAIYVSPEFYNNPHLSDVSILIEEGRKYTNTVDVTITNNANGAVYMYISETPIAISTIPDSYWKAYTETVDFTLTTGDGSKTIYGYFKDVYGDVADTSDEIILDTKSPIIGDLSGVEYTNKVSGDKVEIVASGFDDFEGSADIDYYTVTWQYRVNDGELLYGSQKSTTSNSDTFLMPITAEGKYTVRITLTDRAGNGVDTYKEIDVIVDRTAPEITSITENQIINIADGETVLIKAEDIIDPVNGVLESSGVDYCEWSYSYNSNTPVQSESTIKNESSELEFSIAGEGTYEVTITAYDKAGNSSNKTTTVIIDRTGLEISEYDVDLSADTTTITATITGAIDNAEVAGYKYYIGNQADTLVFITEQENNIYTFEGLAPSTGYYIAFEVVDIYGNISDRSEAKLIYTLANAPTGLVASDGLYATKIEIQWSNNDNPAGVTYEVVTSDDNSTWNEIIYVGQDLSYTHTGLNSNTTKYYKVRAKNQDGVYTEYSNSDEGSTIADTLKPIGYTKSTENITLGLSNSIDDEVYTKVVAKKSDTIEILVKLEDEKYQSPHSITENYIALYVELEEATYEDKTVEIVEVSDGIEITITISGIEEEGELLVKIPAGKISDTAGNTNDELNLGTGIVIDNTLPVIAVEDIKYSEDAVITISDASSGIKYWGVTSAEVQPDTWYEVENTTEEKNVTSSNLNAGTYFAWIKDLAGNVNNVEFTVSQKELIVTPDEGQNKAFGTEEPE